MNIETKQHLSEFFSHALQLNATDIHITHHSPFFIRTDGKLQTFNFPISYEKMHSLCMDILDSHSKAEFEKNKEVDFSFELLEIGRFRANYYHTQQHFAAAFRAISSTPPTLESLNLPKIFYDILKKDRGLILVCGATGSGKSSTISAMIDHINQTQQKHIIALEDPTEFIHPQKQSLFSYRCIGKDTASYQTGIKAALREDPDIIHIGEMRDCTTFESAIHAAQTGHLVFSTLHTNSALGAILKIVGSFRGDEQAQIRSALADSLLMVIAQTLLPKNGGGRVCALEILCNTTAISNLIREAKFHQIPAQMSLGMALGMQTQNDALKKLLQQGVITQESALNASYNQTELSNKLQGKLQ
ncbi:hypothetical protein CCZ01_02525 [Helicobacter monodelphidis]|uniref:type IV pilus twitching motility protein PilT n=1 Tax=Helicobacter sp. 15-1451 TaxID=2004995 RepID=UPI000DCE4D22|nr:PilT/PilU family type 4a pilus ATPase [Helicobacter sp. 15-1451]RAX58676.1 hypothetical protein CCZ01_02525 [Helicobacter sp. 15-1451]